MRQVSRVWVTAAGLLIWGAAMAGAQTASGTSPASGSRAFAVHVTGTGARSMILIPGFLSAGEVWDDVVSHMAPRYRCHVVTLAGFAGVPAVDGPLLPRVRDELIAYIKEQKLNRPVLVGHSLGGLMALWVGSTAPDLVGPIVAIDGVPFLPALMNPTAEPEAVRAQAEQLRTLYRSMTPAQIGMQSRMALAAMISSPSRVDQAAAWAGRSDGRAAGQAIYELMTTDLRREVATVTSEVLIVAAVKATASTPEQIASAVQAYEAQVAHVRRHRVVAATQALHFVMFDDPPFLLSTLDAFLEGKSAPASKGQ